MSTAAPARPRPPQTEEDQKLRVDLAQFVMDLVKAMTKTGYYDPDHPQARQARGGLHAHFRGLMRDRFELGFVRTASAENPEIIVEGVLLEPINLGTLLGKGVGALFVPKFYEYFERHALQSFAIKAGITEEEFGALVEVLTREPGVGRGAGKANLGEALIERRVYHVSTLFSEELLGRERRMNWRVRLALSRLKKDLRLVPLYKDAGPRALQRARDQIVEDVVRPVRRPDLLCTLLVNCDLVPADRMLREGVSLERELMGILPPLLMAPTLAATVKEVCAFAQAAGAMDRVAGAPRLRHLLVDLADRAHDIGGDAGYDALADLFRAKLLSPIDLSPGLKEFIQVQRLAQAFGADPVAGLKELRSLLAQPGEGAAALVGPLVADLLRRGQYPAACAALALALEAPDAAARAREALGREATIRSLLHKFVTAAKEVREQVAELFVLLGPPAVVPLIDLIAQSLDRGVRRAACTTLARLGATAIGPALDRLERPDLPWYLIRNLLMVLGEIGQEVPLDFRRYLRHEDHRVREEAVTALARIPLPEGESLFLNALRDAHPAVRARAVAALGALQTKNIGARHFMAEAIRRKGFREAEEDEGVQLQVCGALQRLGNFPYGGEGRIEAVLVQALEGQGKRGLLGVFGAVGGRSKGPAVRAALVDTLGIIGTSASAGALRRVAEDTPGPLAARAREALRKVLDRPA